MAAAGPAKAGLGGLLRRGWNELPDIVAGTALALLGCVFAGIGLSGYYANDMDNRRYKLGFVIMRPDDPKAAKVHKD